MKARPLNHDHRATNSNLTIPSKVYIEAQL